MSTRNLDFFTTYLESGKRAPSAGRAADDPRYRILAILGRTTCLPYKQLWEGVHLQDVTAAEFTEGMRDLKSKGVIAITPREGADPADPDVRLTPAGAVAADLLLEVG